jgi:hypothetical protein
VDSLIGLRQPNTAVAFEDVAKTLIGSSGGIWVWFVGDVQDGHELSILSHPGENVGDRTFSFVLKS